MSETPIIFIVRDSISVGDKSKLRKAGHLVIEVRYLSDVKFAQPGAAPVEELSHSEILACAATAIRQSGGSVAQYFGAELAKAIIRRHAAPEK